MKKKILLSLLLTLLGLTQAVAQEYVPFVREGVKWVCSNKYGNPETFTLELKGDAVINGIEYKAMHMYTGETINPDDDNVLVYLREQDKVVYGIVPDGKTYDGFPIGNEQDSEMQEKIAAGKEFTLYDFKDAPAFLDKWDGVPFVSMVIPDKIVVGGKEVNRYISSCNGSYCSIEGIGYDGLTSWYTLGYSPNLLLCHVIENGEVIYRSEHFNQVNPGRTHEDLLPFAREGVQWINERVIIDHGDTTRFYYKYEFSGTNFRGHPICYSYTGETLDTDKDEQAAVFQGTYGMGQFIETVYNNYPLYSVIEQGRSMISYPSGTALYSFAQTGSDIESTSPINYYFVNQNEHFLTHENFKEVEPLVIEGIMCRRYAYTDEQGQPLAYLVEGIGFDSRDMGDMLTPFTRKPDPNAEHQEYWGLSHVIKDGEIIYKGMRYRDTANSGEEQYHPTIADVTALIDLLLQNGQHNQMMTSRYDINGDGNLSIADVTALIDVLLNGNAR